jgi:anti-sigma-K factor RskA
MIPDDREELQIMAGEYVLGVLEPEAKREVEAALAENAELRRAVAFWEERLHPLSALTPAAEPPPAVWAQIAARLDGGQTAAARSSLRFWRWATAVATAAAAALLLHIVLTTPAAAPSYVAVLRAPQQEKPAWVATANADGLLIHAVADEVLPTNRSFELWAIAPTAREPQSLGVIPANGRLTLDRLPAAVRDGGTLAISIEPKGGSPTGQPTGPIAFTGALLTVR